MSASVISSSSSITSRSSLGNRTGASNRTGSSNKSRNAARTDQLVHDAASNGNVELLRDLIVQGGGNVEANNSIGQTPLIVASADGHLEVIKYLVEEAGANVEAKDCNGKLFGMTPLIYASDYGHLEVVKYLVEEAGADLKARSNSGKTALGIALENSEDDVVQYLAKAQRQQQKAKQKSIMEMLNTLEQEQKTWIGAKEAKEFTNCETRVELDHAILLLERKATQPEHGSECEQELTKLKSFKNKMPSLEHLHEWEVKLRKEILAKNDTANAVLAKKVEELQARIKLEDEAVIDNIGEDTVEHISGDFRTNKLSKIANAKKNKSSFMRPQRWLRRTTAWRASGSGNA